MSIRDNWADSPPPKRGSLKAINQHKAIADGYEAAPSPLVTDLNFAPMDTGVVCVPGLVYEKGGRKHGRRGY